MFWHLWKFIFGNTVKEHTVIYSYDILSTLVSRVCWVLGTAQSWWPPRWSTIRSRRWPLKQNWSSLSWIIDDYDDYYIHSELVNLVTILLIAPPEEFYVHDENLQKMKLMMNFSMTRWWISRCLPRPSWCMETLRGSRGKPPRLVDLILLRKLITRYFVSPRCKVKVFSQNFPWDWKLAGSNSFFACSQWIMRPITIVISTTPKSPNFPRSVETVH